MNDSAVRAHKQSPEQYRELWNRKTALRAIYTDIYRRMIEASVPGSILELGGGSGNFKSFAPGTVSTDITPAQWLDVVCDAQRLPFASASFSNVVMVDVLHHVENPLHGLTEAARILRPGGRLIFCEPAITPLSGAFYRLFHSEPIDMSVDPLSAGTITPGKDPWQSNQAIPTLLVGRFRAKLAKRLPELNPLRVEWFSFLAYPLSGGFRPWSLVPATIANPLLTIEWQMRKLFGRVAAFRLLAVYERSR